MPATDNNHNQILGRAGETAALEYALSRGYTELGRNIRTPFGELDLILFQNDTHTVVFVEVKTRSSDVNGFPEDAVDSRKLRHVVDSAEFYMRVNYKNESLAQRIDVMAIIYDQIQQEIKDLRWYENVTAE